MTLLKDKNVLFVCASDSGVPEASADKQNVDYNDM